MSWGADCTGCLVLLGASFPLTAADGREFTVFYMADRQTVPRAGLAVGIFRLQPVSTLRGGKLDITQSTLFNSLLVSYKKGRNSGSTLLVPSSVC